MKIHPNSASEKRPHLLCCSKLCIMGNVLGNPNLIGGFAAWILSSAKTVGIGFCLFLLWYAQQDSNLRPSA
jgi:hypothetical protein